MRFSVLNFLSPKLQFSFTAPLSHHSTFNFYEFDYPIPHFSEIIQYLSFSDWLILLSIMSSRFIFVVARVGNVFLFKAGLYSIVCINHMLLTPCCIDGQCVVSTLWLLWIMLLWTQVYNHLFETMLWVLLSMYLEVEFLDINNKLILHFLRKLHTVFHHFAYQ